MNESIVGMILTRKSHGTWRRSWPSATFSIHMEEVGPQWWQNSI